MECKEKNEFDMLRSMADHFTLPGLSDVLEKAISAMKELPKIKKERDALLEDLRQSYRCESCESCKHNGCVDTLDCECDCNICANPCDCFDCIENSNWEWRGVVEHKEGDANG